MNVYVIALEPEKRLGKLIDNQKKQVKYIAGDQIYLNHPPHITLYVLLSDEDEIKNIIGRISENTRKINVQIKDLNVFRDDFKTKCDTIFYEFFENEKLKKMHDYVVSLLSELDESIEKFPFMGDDWHPHMTIASIQKDKSGIIYKKLAGNKINGDFIMENL